MNGILTATAPVLSPAGGRHRLVGRALGRLFALTVPVELVGSAVAGLPVGWTPDSGQPERHWELDLDRAGRCLARVDGRPLPPADGSLPNDQLTNGRYPNESGPDDLAPNEPEASLGLLLADLERWLAEHAVGVVAVRAGAVSWHGRGIALLGPPGSGVSTLVAALVRAGASYYSDRFALLTADGLLAPYPCPVRLPVTAELGVAAVAGRGSCDRIATTMRDLGGSSGTEPVPLAVVAVLTHDPIAGWDVRLLSAGHTVLALAERALGVGSRSRDVMAHVLAAVRGTTGVVGTRGEAAGAAQRILGL